MQIDIINETEHTLTAEQEQLIGDIVRTVLTQEQKNQNAAVAIIIVSNEEIRSLNHTHRGMDHITDVLSFPMINFDLGETVPNTGTYLLGDIVFSYDKAIAQANEYGHSLDREIGFFIAHSMLHLLGYDHDDSTKEALMIAKQNNVLQAIGLTR